MQNTDADTTESLLGLFMSQDDHPIPCHEGSVFFPPLQSIFALLGMPELLKQRYERNNQPGGLTWKTFSKWMCNSPVAMQHRPTQLLKLSKMLASVQSVQGMIQDVQLKDALWKPYAEWLLLVRHAFHREECTSHWEALLEAEWQLMCKVLPFQPTIQAKLEALANSPLMATLGVPSSRGQILQLLACEPDPEKLLVDPRLINCRIADFFTFLYRFAAWYIVDASLAHREHEVRNELLFEELLPVRLEAGGWSDAVKSCLENFAQSCGCSPDETLSSSLGRVWAEYDDVQVKFPEVSSRQHSLRDWLSGEKGRPKRQGVLSLATAVALKAAKMRGLGGSRGQDEINGLVYRFHFAETSRYLLGEMTKMGFTDELIKAVFSSFAQEYRKAHRLLGLPLV